VREFDIKISHGILIEKKGRAEEVDLFLDGNFGVYTGAAFPAPSPPVPTLLVYKERPVSNDPYLGMY
jgi:hypothetical protein